MTYAQFLEQLRATPREWWFLNESLQIRARARRLPKFGVCCPITAVEPHLLAAAGVYEAGKSLGLSEHLLTQIMHAADDVLSRYPPPGMRAELLAAVGLTEAST